jgi:glycosyltransferase involved in cell wall biosynthesis
MIKMLYITFIDFNSGTSGSSVRPAKMYEAFRELGIEVKLLEGQQNRRRQRRRQVREILEWLKTNRPDICYIEPPSGPFFNRIDLTLLRKLKQMGVPTGLFYRDMYWKFDLENEIRDVHTLLKNRIVAWMHRRDWRVFMQTLSILYFPTQDMARLLTSRIPTKALPPGCFIGTETAQLPHRNEIPTAIYIGGMSEIYGPRKMLQAAQILADQGTRFKLKLICRQPEWERFVMKYNYQTPPWLEVLHISGDEALFAQYAQADFALCPHQTGGYNEVTISVKIMEYLSYLKPVVVTCTRPMKALVETHDIGIVTEDSAEAFAQGMLCMIQNPELRENLRQNCLVARDQHLWVRRAQSVIEDLTALREEAD